MNAPAVPVYVRPRTVVAATVAAAAGVVGAFYVAAAGAAALTWRVLHDHPLYGPPKEKP